MSIYRAQRVTRTAAVLALVLTTSCGKDTDDEAAAPRQSTAAVAASVAQIGLASFTDVVDGIGTVAARVGHVAALSAPAATRVTAVRVSVGDRVAAGTALIEFEHVAFDAAVASADAALTAAQQAAARARRLVDAGVAPRKDAELTSAELAAAEANAANAHRAKQLSRMRSPIAGVVTRLSAVLGASVDAGQSLVEIADPAAVDILLSVPPATAARVRSGQPVVLRDGVSSESPVVGTGRVADISATIDSATRSVLLRITVVTRTRTLRLGESLFGEITTATHANAVVVPDDALVPTGEGFRVFVVDSAGIAHARDVRVGGRRGHSVWIVEGVKSGDVIVTKGAYGMDDGARVVKATP